MFMMIRSMRPFQSYWEWTNRNVDMSAGLWHHRRDHMNNTKRVRPWPGHVYINVLHPVDNTTQMFSGAEALHEPLYLKFYL